MNVMANEIASKKCLDQCNESDNEEDKANKYCTATWLSEFLDFMFDRHYLHQEDELHHYILQLDL
mgnify:CR=1 FL=1